MLDDEIDHREPEVTHQTTGKGWFKRMDEGEGNGMRCPDCHCCDLRAFRTEKKAGCYRRIRVCRNCGKKITTVEHPRDP